MRLGYPGWAKAELASRQSAGNSLERICLWRIDALQVSVT